MCILYRGREHLQSGKPIKKRSLGVKMESRWHQTLSINYIIYEKGFFFVLLFRSSELRGTLRGSKEISYPSTPDRERDGAAQAEVCPYLYTALAQAINVIMVQSSPTQRFDLRGLGLYVTCYVLPLL